MSTDTPSAPPSSPPPSSPPPGGQGYQPPPPGGHHYPPLSVLRRSRSDRKVLGVAGGLGRWAGIDPLVLRILFVVLTIFGGSGVLLYGAGWLLVPDDGQSQSEGHKLLRGSQRSTGRILLLVAVIVVAVLATGATFDSGPGLGGLALLAVIAVAVVMLQRSNNDPRPPVQNPPPGYEQQPVGSYGQTAGTAYTAPDLTATATDLPYAVAATPTAPYYGPPLPPSSDTMVLQQPVPPPAPRKPRSILGRLTVSAALIAIGALVAWNLATTGYEIPAQAVIAVALAVVGLGLLVGAVAGRSRGLVVWGLLLTLAASAASVSGVSVDGGVGDRVWRPTTAQALRPVYRLGAGNAELDLRRLDPATLGRARVDVRQGAGDLLVILPADAVVVVDASVRVGEIRFPGVPVLDGTDLASRAVLPDGSAASAAVLTIDAELGAGSLEVRRARS